MAPSSTIPGYTSRLTCPNLSYIFNAALGLRYSASSASRYPLLSKWASGCCHSSSLKRNSSKTTPPKIPMDSPGKAPVSTFNPYNSTDARRKPDTPASFSSKMPIIEIRYKPKTRIVAIYAQSGAIAFPSTGCFVNAMTAVTIPANATAIQSHRNAGSRQPLVTACARSGKPRLLDTSFALHHCLQETLSNFYRARCIVLF